MTSACDQQMQNWHVMHLTFFWKVTMLYSSFFNISKPQTPFKTARQKLPSELGGFKVAQGNMNHLEPYSAYHSTSEKTMPFSKLCRSGGIQYNKVPQSILSESSPNPCEFSKTRPQPLKHHSDSPTIPYPTPILLLPPALGQSNAMRCDGHISGLPLCLGCKVFPSRGA